MSETYIYDNTEVVMTGRTAVKAVAKTKRRSGRSPVSTDRLYEVKPADPENGTWKKWVRQRDLYEIQKEDNNNERRDKNNNTHDATGRDIPRQAIPKTDDENTA